MTTPDSTPDRDEPKVAPHYRPTLSRNQKRRSKLQQVPDETVAPAPLPAANPEPAPPPVPAPPPPAPLRRMRLKRSGHMHDDLTKPLPGDEPAEREPEY